MELSSSYLIEIIKQAFPALPHGKSLKLICLHNEEKENHITGDSVLLMETLHIAYNRFHVVINIHLYADSRGNMQHSKIKAKACFFHMQVAPHAHYLQYRVIG